MKHNFCDNCLWLLFFSKWQKSVTCESYAVILKFTNLTRLEIQKNMAPVLGNLKTLAHSLLSQSFWLHLAWKICIFGFIYIVILLFFIDDALPPNGNLFHMFMLFIWANICGQLAFIFNLPPLFGMLVAGI